MLPYEVKVLPIAIYLLLISPFILAHVCEVKPPIKQNTEEETKREEEEEEEEQPPPCQSQTQ